MIGYNFGVVIPCQKAHRTCETVNIMFFICQVATYDHVIKESYDIAGVGPLL